MAQSVPDFMDDHIFLRTLRPYVSHMLDVPIQYSEGAEWHTAKPFHTLRSAYIFN
jgi:hypothetical protein